ncbi:phosphatidylinositol 4-kinase gamma 7-like [Mangifera indica]|uniref:phosphatidylinositol 4-kinase gamma 7-like n=1 Tax=Mangifera indica TaxID=29780 RepID=UPI001CFA4B44|nr:phosphatidylinositol 4-kinase gamma 7-like [Mangifera indica]XP_044477686.1 phosphatidylinositol 4-kinase gamma 7-like [Mangifera indica]
MSQNFGSPVQTQMVVSVLNSHCGIEYHGDLRTKSTGTRRVFVQTDNGCVLGMELNRNDNARTVKRRLQLALNVPTDESSLTFGDLTLNNDLSAIRNDSPLLLTRNAMHRSSSTPCLSPTGKDQQQRDQSGPIEILGSLSCFPRTNELIKDIFKAIKNGVDPIPIHSGLGGAYFFRNCKGDNIAIVKPTDEEPFAPNNPKGFLGKALGQPGLKRSVRVGETGFREVAAYLLDYNNFANVPPTVLVKVTHSIFNLNDAVVGNKLHKREKVSKIASLQQFMPHDFDAGDYGTLRFPVAAIHRIGILDIRIFNTDRHAGNLLVRKLGGVGRFSQVELIPIDHGLCLPECLEDPYFEWIHWPQASIPFSEDELEYIKNLDPLHDSEMLRTELPMIREGCLRVLVLCTIFLKEAAAFGLCLSEIGEMMSREFSSKEEEPSELEALCLEARRIMIDRELSYFDGNGREEQCLFDLDCEDAEFESGDIPSELETLEEEQWNWIQTTPKVSQPVNIHERSWPHLDAKPEESQLMGSISESIRSADEKLSNCQCFVKLVDMKEGEWSVFLEQFKELLHPAFTKRRCSTIGWRQRQRLGTSCKF